MGRGVKKTQEWKKIQTFKQYGIKESILRINYWVNLCRNWNHQTLKKHLAHKIYAQPKNANKL